MQTFYYAHITHDGLKGEDVPKGKRKVLIYIAGAINFSEADRQFKELESQFQGQNFKILISGELQCLSNSPVFLGMQLQPTSHQLVTDWNDLQTRR